MKTPIKSLLLGSAFSLILAIANATTYTEILNETAPAGTQMGPGNGPPLSMGIQADGLLNQNAPTGAPGVPTLQFALSNNGANQMVAGDVLIWEDHVGGTLSDVLRFENWGVGYVYVYSDPSGADGPATLADHIFPSLFQVNSINFVEQFDGTRYGLFNYIPLPGQPGYSSFVNGLTTAYAYDFTSEESSSLTAVPEGGSTLALLGLGLAGVESLRRKLRTRRS